MYEFLDEPKRIARETSRELYASSKKMVEVKRESQADLAGPLPEPASWSILKQTITNLFGLNDEVRNSILNTADELSVSELNLPDEELAKLTHASIYNDDTFYTLLALSLEYIIELQISQRTFESIIDVFKMLCDRHGVPTAVPQIKEFSEILADSEIAKIGGLRIDSFDIPHELADELAQRGFTLWRDLTGKTEKGILESSGICWDGLKLVYLLWQAKAYARIEADRFSKCDSHSSFANMASAFLSLPAKDDRAKTIMLGRLGLLKGNKWTLDELGKLFGITRERIRQIESGRLDSLRHHSRLAKLAVFRKAVTETLRLAGGVCFLDELKTGVTEKLQWEQESNEEAFSSFVALFGGIKMDIESELAKDPNHKCVSCGLVVSALDKMFIENKRERTLSDVATFLQSCCAITEECNKYSKLLKFSEGFVSFVAEKTKNVLVDNDLVYCRGTWSTRRGTHVQLVESILRTAGQPMHFNEVYEKALSLLPQGDKTMRRNVHSWLDRSDNLLLWDRGTFVHCDCIEIPSGLVSEIETWLIKRLRTGLPFIYITAAFDVFLKRCTECNIISESALYTCMRRWGSSQLSYPRYPQVYFSNDFESLISSANALEQFIYDEGAEVSYETLREYSRELGLKEFQLQQSLPKLSNVVRTKRSGLVHITFLKVDLSKLDILVDYVRDLLQKVNQVSISKVFDDKIVTCTLLGIETPEMLFSLLRLVCADDYDLSHYPLVRLVNNGLDHSKGMVFEIVDYIRQKLAPCSIDELETRFVQELGYSEQSVQGVTTVNSVLRFGRGSLVHIDTLQWTDESQLEFYACNALTQANTAGRCYALVTDLMEYYQLPVLGNGVAWTKTLLAELLTRGQRFRILGSARNAFVRVPNDYAIETLEDLIYQMLKASYEGATDLSSFEEYLRREGIVQKKITFEMLGNKEKVTISGNLIMLTQLCEHA